MFYKSEQLLILNHVKLHKYDDNVEQDTTVLLFDLYINFPKLLPLPS